MERIDLLWDAWEDCLCKEQLRAEFDRLKAELEGAGKACKSWHRGFDEACRQRDEAQAENERLKKDLDKWLDVSRAYYGDPGRWREKFEQAQAHLDKISEPMIEPLKACHSPSNLPNNVIQAVTCRVASYLRAKCIDADYLDSQKGEKPYCNHWSIKDYSEKHSGKQVDCPTCNPPKCEHKNLTPPLGNPPLQHCADCDTWNEPKKPQPKCEHKNIHDGVKGVYGKQWRLDCNVTLTGDF